MQPMNGSREEKNTHSHTTQNAALKYCVMGKSFVVFCRSFGSRLQILRKRNRTAFIIIIIHFTERIRRSHTPIIYLQQTIYIILFELATDELGGETAPSPLWMCPQCTEHRSILIPPTRSCADNKIYNMYTQTRRPGFSKVANDNISFATHIGDDVDRDAPFLFFTHNFIE